MRKVIALLMFLILIGTACTMLTLQPADFSWPVESVIKVDDQGKCNRR